MKLLIPMDHMEELRSEEDLFGYFGFTEREVSLIKNNRLD
jgi:hypothetical protein